MDLLTKLLATTQKSSKFFKYNSCGNDFVLIEGEVPPPADVVRQICDRKRGVGADGLILLSSKMKMRIFNRDGGEAEMCGNGLRAVIFHLIVVNHLKGPVEVTSEVSVHVGDLAADGEIIVEMGYPKVLFLDRFLLGVSCDLIDTGVPHLIIEPPLPELFEKLAPQLRHHKTLEKGANVTLVENKGGLYHCTTYERGVEGVTDACGTGVVAAAWSLHTKKGLSSPIRIKTFGGDILTVLWDSEVPKRPKLKGKTTLVFDGVFPSGII